MAVYSNNSNEDSRRNQAGFVDAVETCLPAVWRQLTATGSIFRPTVFVFFIAKLEFDSRIFCLSDNRSTDHLITVLTFHCVAINKYK